MKKLLLVLAIASFAACNDAGSGTENGADTTVTTAPVDSAATMPAPVDSAATTPVDSVKTGDTSAIKK